MISDINTSFKRAVVGKLERVHKFINGPGSIIIAFTGLATIFYSLAIYLDSRYKFNEDILFIGVLLYLISVGILIWPVGGERSNKRTVAIFIVVTGVMSFAALVFVVLYFFLLSYAGV